MYLARVAKDQLDHDPVYWNGAGWSASSDDAVPISDRFYAENTMQPRYIDGQWISVVQRDGFPSSSADTGVQIVISENAILWHRAIADPSNYRPGVFEMEWPGDPDRIIEDALARLASGSADPG